MYLIDTADTEIVKELVTVFEFRGVTTNPSLIAKENAHFFNRVNALSDAIAPNPVYVQVNAESVEAMMQEVSLFKERLKRSFVLKVPTTREGFKLMRRLKGDTEIAATAVSNFHQGMMSVECGAGTLVVYVQRLIKEGLSPIDLIKSLRDKVDKEGLDVTILAASFDSPPLVESALANGAHMATVKPKILWSLFKHQATEKSVRRFSKLFQETYKKAHTATERE